MAKSEEVSDDKKIIQDSKNEGRLGRIAKGHARFGDRTIWEKMII